MSVELLERAAQALEPVLSDVVFLGGASIVLWVTDPAAPAPRPTNDVDVAWQGASIPHAVKRALPSGATILATRPDYLLATKIEAFNDRGHEDFLGSRDFGDMIALIDGRHELVAEVQQSESDLRAYLVSELSRLRAHPRFREGISGALRADSASQARAEAVVLPRLEQISG